MSRLNEELFKLQYLLGKLDVITEILSNNQSQLKSLINNKQS